VCEWNYIKESAYTWYGESRGYSYKIEWTCISIEYWLWWEVGLYCI